MRIVTLVGLMVLTVNLQAAGENGSLIYLRPADIIHLNPWQADDIYSTEIASNIFEGLVRFQKSTTAIEPCLATSWQVSDNGRQWRFILRRGVTFHDNSPFDARSVVDTFRSRMGQQGRVYQRLRFLFSFISTISSQDPFSVDIRLNRPYAPFLIALADAAVYIQSPAARQASPYLPVGTGPFRFASWSKGKSLILTRSADYWGGRRSAEKIIFKVMPDSLGRLLQIKNGSADLAVIQSAKEYEELSLRSEIAILSQPSITIHYLGFNTRKKPFDLWEIRAAFQHIILKERLVKQVFQKLAEPASSPLPLAIYPAGPPAPSPRFDPNAARALLTKAKLENGFSCTLHFQDGQEGLEGIADLLAVYAKSIKINIKKIKLPFAELVKVLDRGEHDILLMGWATNPDPDFFLYPLFTFMPGNRNRFFYSDPELTRLLDLGKFSTNGPQRQQIYRDALAILDRDIPWIPLFHLVRTIACNKRITGLGFNPLGQILFRDVTLESKP